MTTQPAPLVPVSWGELIDKITILEIKAARITHAPALANVRAELALLADVAAPVLAAQPPAQTLRAELRRVNEALWEIEDRIRDKERAGDFGADFIALARAVYRTNDERGRLKKQVNTLLGSPLTEEKHYARY